MALTSIQRRVLDVMACRKQTVTLGDLARITRRNSGIASLTLNALMRRGLVTVTESDRFALTERGRREASRSL